MVASLIGRLLAHIGTALRVPVVPVAAHTCHAFEPLVFTQTTGSALQDCSASASEWYWLAPVAALAAVRAGARVVGIGA